MRKYVWIVCLLGISLIGWTQAAGTASALSLRESQQQFVNLKFGMFIHFNMGTYMNEDWADPNAPLSLFNPTKLDCGQWARTARSAKMRYGCLTTKHHNGFCNWDTKTTDYNVMGTPIKRDVVREFSDAFRKEGLKVMLYYSILDMHHDLRPGCITQSHIEMVKEQLTELFTNYGEIEAVIIDGWDAPWSRISYEDVPFEEIYRLIKRLQPNCLVMDLNAAKYPKDALFYTDIKSYEQNAGQHISKETNQLPALSCLPINPTWFWKDSFPTSSVKTPDVIINQNVNPMNRVGCNFILNVAPNRDGLIDDNVVKTLAEVGKLWDDKAVSVPVLSGYDAPIISRNIAKHQTCRSSWASDMWIMDFANDDNFSTAWRSNPQVKEPWYEIDFKRVVPFNMITLADPETSIADYSLYYEKEGVWYPIPVKTSGKTIKVHRFERLWGQKIKLVIKQSSIPPSIAEVGVYDER